MSTRIRRCLLVMLALPAALVGIWAYFLTQSWYDAFPGLGHSWLPVLGPFNEHLAKDVGAAYLALTVLSAGAAYRAADGFLVRLTGLAWVVFSIPHMYFHLWHLGMYDGVDKALNVVTLSYFVVLGAVLILPERPVRRG